MTEIDISSQYRIIQISLKKHTRLSGTTFQTHWSTATGWLRRQQKKSCRTRTVV